jgi:hypothetical protein
MGRRVKGIVPEGRAHRVTAERLMTRLAEPVIATPQLATSRGIVPEGRAHRATAERLMTPWLNQLSQRDNW